jgi:NADH dehydrogenase
MIGRNAAVAELGKHHHELTGPIAFAAWLGIHAALLTTNRAKLESLIEWAWDYFGRSRSDSILDRPGPASIPGSHDEAA